MLPSGYHEEVCKLLCTWLRRLEERDKNHATSYQTSIARAETTDRTHVENNATNRAALPDLSSCLNTGAEEKRQCRDAAGQDVCNTMRMGG